MISFTKSNMNTLFSANLIQWTVSLFFFLSFLFFILQHCYSFFSIYFKQSMIKDTLALFIFLFIFFSLRYIYLNFCNLKYPLYYQSILICFMQSNLNSQFSMSSVFSSSIHKCNYCILLT